EITGPLPSGLDKRSWEGDFSEQVPFRIGKPGPVSLPKPKKDPLTEPHNSIAVMPYGTFYQLSLTNPNNGSHATIISNLNIGGQIELAMKLGPTWSLRTRADFLSTSLQ